MMAIVEWIGLTNWDKIVVVCRRRRHCLGPILLPLPFPPPTGAQ